MLRLAFACVLLLAANSALAQPVDADEPPPPPAAAVRPATPAAFVGATGGMAWGNWLEAALSVEGAHVIPGTQLFAHASATVGGDGDGGWEGSGNFYRGLVGLQTWCTGSDTCTFAGADVGYQLLTWSESPGEMVENHHGFVVAGRIGIDAGGEQLRFRAAIELAEFRDHSDVAGPQWDTDLGFSLGLAYRM